MLKMGAYGFLRFCPAPSSLMRLLEATPLIMTLAVVGIVYGALVAMVPT